LSTEQLDTKLEEDSPQKINAFQVKKWLKWVGVFAVSILIFVIGFMFLTEFLAAKLLRSQVSEQTNNVYELNFSDLSIHWLSATIILSETSFSEVNPARLDTAKMDFDFKVNELYIEIENLSAIYFAKTLHVVSIRISQPNLEIRKLVKSDKKTSFSFETGNLYEVLQGFVSTFQVDELSVQNMHLKYYAPQKEVPFVLNDLSFRIMNFHLDSNAIQAKNDFFFTESFDLKIVDQRFLFGDGIHYSHFDSLVLSTTRNNIEVYNITTDTLIGCGVKLAQKPRNRYYSYLPYVGIIGLDFKEAYQKDVLHIDTMIYQSPQLSGDIISVRKDSNKIKANQEVDNGLVSLVLSVFDRIELDRFDLNKASLSAQYGEKDSANIESLTLQFTKFVLDSNDLNRDVYYPNFKQLVLRIDNPQFNLPNHSVMQADYLQLSTFDSSLTINDVLIMGEEGDKNQPDFSGGVDQIRLVGINSQEIINKHIIRLDSFQIIRPRINVTVKSGGKKGKGFDIESFLADGIHLIQVKRIDIKNGSLKLNEQLISNKKHGIAQFNIALNHFALNKAALKNPKFLLSNSAYLDFKNISVYVKDFQHEVDLKEFRVSTIRKEIEITGLAMLPLVRDSSSLKLLANVKMNQFLLKGLSLNKLTNFEKVDVSKIYLKHVDANIVLIPSDSLSNDTTSVDTASTNNWEDFLTRLEKVELRDVEVEDINVSVQKNGASVVKFSNGRLHANELLARPEKLQSGRLMFLTDSLSYGLSKIVLPLTKAKHMLTIQDFSRNTDSSLVVTDLSMRPIPGVYLPDSAFKGVVYVPEIKVSEFHAFEKRFSDTLSIGQIKIESPRVRLRLAKKDTSKPKMKLMSHLSKPILNEIEAIGLKQFTINNGDIEIVKDSLRVNVGDFDLDSRNWFISDSTKWEPNKFFWADDFDLNLANLNYDIPGFDICHNIDSLSYHFTPNALTVHGIYFNTVKPHKPDSGSFFSLYLPDIQFKNPHIYDYLNDSVLVIDTIITDGGMFEGDFFMAKKDSTKPKSKFIMLDQIPDNLGGMNRIAVNTLAVAHMDTEIRLHGKKNVAPLDIDEFNLRIDSFHVVPGEVVDSNRVLWADNIVLDVDNIYTTLDEGLLEFGADNFHISTKEDSIGITNITFVPAVNRYEYPLYKGGFQRDVFTVFTKEVGISDLDFSKALYTSKIQGKYLKVDHPSLNILKDKRNLKPPYKYKAIIPEMFKKLPVSITFDSLVVKEMRIRYEESPEKGRNSGTIKLSHMNIVARNATNDTAQLQKDSMLVIEMSAKLLDTADLDFKISYDMLSPVNQFSMSTTLGPFDATLFNSFIEPVYKAQIKSADIKGMDMIAIGNDSVAGGKMGLYYENLKFRFLDSESGESEGLGNKLKSGIGNAIVSQNNKYHYLKGRKPLFFVRDTGKGWIGYLIKIELAGVMSSVGLKKYRKDLKKVNKEVWKAFDKKDKEERKQRLKETKAALKLEEKQQKAQEKADRKENRKRKKNKKSDG